MHDLLGSVLIGLHVGLALLAFVDDSLLKGRHLTRRFARPDPISIVLFRMGQVCFFLGVGMLIDMAVYNAAMTAIYLDDYMSGSDRGRRLREWARNRVRWLMELPSPAAPEPA